MSLTVPRMLPRALVRALTAPSSAGDVEAGVDLVAFTSWLPEGVTSAFTPSADVALAPTTSTELATGKKGIPLSRLLNGVATAVAEAFAGGVWALVEVNEATARNGHVYLDLSERDSGGQLIAKARGTIWASTAARILPAFERATGAVIGAGLRLLVRAKPVFKSQYGFSLEIDAIDAEYTLGVPEARKKEIRARLQQKCWRRPKFDPLEPVGVSALLDLSGFRGIVVRTSLQHPVWQQERRDHVRMLPGVFGVVQTTSPRCRRYAMIAVIGEDRSIEAADSIPDLAGVNRSARSEIASISTRHENDWSRSCPPSSTSRSAP